jgi:small-conductance mechanosensitive channel
VNFVLRVSTASGVDHPWIFQSNLMIEISRVFHEQGIEIPFPQRDIHVRSVDAALRIAGADETKSDATGDRRA